MNTKIPSQNYPAALKILGSLFSFPREQQEQMIKDFIGQIEAGLAGGPGKLKMIPTYMNLPTGKEEGDILAIDMGGTNLRVMMVRLKASNLKPCILKVNKCRLSAADMGRDAHTLFARVAKEMDTFLQELKQQEFSPPLEVRKVGFTFSYPVTMISRNTGKIAALAKKLTASGLIGKNPFDLLFSEFYAITRNQPKGYLSRLHPSALLNDTVTELIYAAYLKRITGSEYPCRIGGIIGTGNNFALVVRKESITKFNDPAYTPREMIINMESGNFDAPSLPCNVYDDLVDAGSSNPGAQRLEKTIAGNYLGRIAGAVLLDLVEAGYLLQKDKQTRQALENFSCIHMSNIEKDFHTAVHVALKELQAAGLPAATMQDLAVVRDVSALIARRAAVIAATNIAAVIRYLDPAGPEKQTVAIDGSVFGKYPGYKSHMESVLKELFGKQSGNIKLEYIYNGSGIGAAIAAAC